MHITTLKLAILNLPSSERVKLLCKLLESLKSLNSKEVDDLRAAAASWRWKVLQADADLPPRAAE